MKKRFRFVYIGAAVCMVTAFFSGCQENPDSSIVVNKDMDRLIEEAKKSDENSVNMEDIASIYETYQTTLSDESLGVTVNVDAKVDIPEVEQMSIFRVEQKKISQEFLDKVIGELVQGQTLYDAGVMLNTKTRKDIEAEISDLKAEIQACEDNGGDEVAMSEYQQALDELQEEYENAPTQLIWEGNESDGLLHSVSELAEKEGGEDFYQFYVPIGGNPLFAAQETA